MIRPYLIDMINDHKAPLKLPDKEIDSENNFGEWKIQIKMRNICISSKRFEETRTIYSPSNKVKILIGIETDDIIDELFESLLQRSKIKRNIK